MKNLKIVLVVIWMIVIFMFSNQKANDSSKLSDGLILKTVRIIEHVTNKKYSDDEILKLYVKPVRKMAHFTIYLILGILVCLMIKEYSVKNIILLSVLTCFIYASSDEIHQLFIDGRSCNIIDVFIDTFGSFIGILLVRREKNEKK